MHVLISFAAGLVVGGAGTYFFLKRGALSAEVIDIKSKVKGKL